MLMNLDSSHRTSWCVAVLLHWTKWAAIGSFSIALAVGHFRPPGARDRDRIPGPPRPVIVKGGESWRPDGGGVWVDPSTGEASTLPLPPGGWFSNAVIAPWQDRDDGTQAVGGWISHGTADLPSGSYLARFALPAGTFLDAIPLASLLDGPPCWFPGDPDRVLFAQQDGELYEFDFREEERPGRDGRPRRLGWRVPRPLGEGSRIHAPSWPSDPRLGGRILVSIEPRAVGPRGLDFQELWWLQLGEGGTEVEAAGPIGPPADAARGQGRFPVVATDPAGRLDLAYLSKAEGSPHYELRIASLEADEATGAPILGAERARVLAGRCHPTPPIVSPDGSSIFAVSAEPTRLDVRRHPLR